MLRENYANIKKDHKNLKEVVDNKNIINEQIVSHFYDNRRKKQEIDDYIESLKQKDMEERAQKDEERNSEVLIYMSIIKIKVTYRLVVVGIFIIQPR